MEYPVSSETRPLTKIKKKIASLLFEIVTDFVLQDEFFHIEFESGRDFDLERIP